MKKHAFRKTVFRAIRGSLGRYLAIIGIIALGSGFFTGLKVTKSDMLETLDRYLDRTSFFDCRLLSTIGWEENDTAEMRKIPGVTAAEGAVTVDFIARIGEGEMTLRAHTLTDTVNVCELTEGRMPEGPDECLVDDYGVTMISLGDAIRVASDNTADTADSLRYDTYTVVGKARTPLYINFERGSTSIGNGTVSGFVLIPADGFSTEYQTEIWLKLDASGRPFSDAYKDRIAALRDSVTAAAEKTANERYGRIVSEAEDKVAEAEADYADGRSEYESGLADYENGKQEYEDGLRALGDAKISIEQEYADGQSRLDDAERELRDAETALDEKAAELADRRSELEAACADAETKRSGIEAGIAEIRSNLAMIPDLEATRGTRLALEAKLAELISAQQMLADTFTVLSGYVSELEDGEKQIEAGYAEIRKSRAEIEAGRTAAQQLYDEGWQTIRDRETELADAEKELGDARAKLDDAERELEDGKRRIDDAKAEIAGLEPPDVYVLERDSNIGYACYESDADIVSGIARVFPVFFFAVAALVCVTTISRMVDDERGQLGTLKALGYGEGVIMSRYFFYTGSAALIGCLVGVVAGSYVFPTAIWQAYNIMYSMPAIVIRLDLSLMLLAGGSYLALALLVTWLGCRTELASPASELIRPKSPPPGKRILLEHLTPLWKRLRFLHKVSLRNVFRYRKRFIMMVLGIGGCTALLVTGLGLNDSITDIANRQFETISVYDAAVSFSGDMAGRQDAFLGECGDGIDRCAFLYSASVSLRTGAASGTVTLCGVGSFEELDGLMRFHYRGRETAVPDEGACIISENLAQKYKLSPGDTVTVTVGDTETVTLRIADQFENVIYNYIYTSIGTLRPYLGDLPLKTAYLGFAGEDGGEPDRDMIHAVAAGVASAEDVTNVSVSCDMLDRVNSMLDSMKYVVWLVIGCAAALAFIVLFNLTNINIQERIREIATIKVLGFQSGETAQYVFRENLILTFCGCVLGIPLGIWLHTFVMSQIQIDMVAFTADRSLLTYVLSVVLTFGFTVAVNYIMRPRLSRINMAEALKSVE